MRSTFQDLRRLFRPPLSPRQFPSDGFQILDNSLSIEEEREPFYSPTIFYPARIGEVLNSRYQAAGKLDYVGYSTVWRCRDLMCVQYKQDHVPIWT